MGAIPSLPPDGIARARASNNARRFGDLPARLRALVEQQNRRRRRAAGATARTTTTTTARTRRGGRRTDSDDSLGTPRRSPPSWGAPSWGAPSPTSSASRHTPPTPGSAAVVPRHSLRRNYDRVVDGQRRRIGRRGAHSVTETHTTTIVYKDGRPPEVHHNSSRHTTPDRWNQSGSGLLPLKWFV